MDFGIINTTITSIAKYINQARDIINYSNTQSLSDVTKLTRVEPLTILSKDLINLEYMPDVQQSLLSLFSAYYLQAVSVLTTINNVEVVRVLDRLNPNRDETGWLLQASLESVSIKQMAMESYEYALPGTTGLALEEKDNNADQIAILSNLSVGKLLNVQIGFRSDVSETVTNQTIGGNSTKVNGKPIVKDKEWSTSKKTIDDKPQSVTIPVQVRLMASVIPNATITRLLALKTEDNGIVERYHAWRAGRISFIKDLIFCQDMIDEYKKSMIQDETDTLQEILRRVNNAKKFGLLTKNPSLVSASNLFVISEQVAREIEQKLGGKLSSKRIRDKAFENTYAMIIAVVDREWERVTFYTRGMAASTDLSIKEIKNSSKGKGPDVLDIFRSLSLGSPVSF